MSRRISFSLRLILRRILSRPMVASIEQLSLIRCGGHRSWTEGSRTEAGLVILGGEERTKGGKQKAERSRVAEDREVNERSVSESV